MIDTNSFILPSSGQEIGTGTDMSKSSIELKSSEYLMEKQSNGLIICKIYMLAHLKTSPSYMTLNWSKSEEFRISLPINISKIKNVNIYQLDASLNDSIVITSAMNLNNENKLKIQIAVASPSNKRISTGDINDLLIYVEGTI